MEKLDKVDLLLKIKRLEKQKLLLELEIKLLKKKISQQEKMEANLLIECAQLSHELTKWRPFDDADEIIVQSKLNKK